MDILNTFRPCTASHLREIRGWGPLAPPLQSVWHAHCDVIAAESRWWKTLSLLKQVISINIYTGAAGNDTSRRFSVCGDENGKKSDVNEGVPHPLSSGMSTDPFIIIFVSIFTFCTKFFFKSINPSLWANFSSSRLLKLPRMESDSSWLL